MCPFLQPGDVLGKLLSIFCGLSEGLLLDACGFSSLGLCPFSVRVSPTDPLVVVEEAAVLLCSADLSAEGLSAEACPEPTDLLAELKDVRGRGIELLFESLRLAGDKELERGNADELLFDSVVSVTPFSIDFVLVDDC